MASSPAKNTLSIPISSSSTSPTIPSRPSPKPRNSETGDPMRRSFRGSPFPTDSSRRISIGGGGGDKENQIENVVKAPKATKHFMSPTISAVSKINQSPRKKVLTEKNEVSRSFDKINHHQVRSSVSFSDVISIIEDDIDREEFCIEEMKQESYDVTVTDFDEICEIKKSDELGFGNSPVPYKFPVFGSQEVESSMVAPYDPKKNYLSPRPQFLHYRPNPRVESRGFDECKQLDELFGSEISSSETDLSAEESQQEEEVVSAEEVVAVEEEIVEVEDEKKSLEVVESDEEEEEVDCEEEEETKESGFKIAKVVRWGLAFGVVCLLLVSSVAFIKPEMIQDSAFYKFHVPPEVTKSVREGFEELSVKLGVWSESSLVYLDKLVSSLREEEDYGSFQYHNLTDIVDDASLSDAVFQTSSGEINVGGLLMDSQDWNLEMDVEEESGEAEEGDETNIEAVYEEDGDGFELESENSEMLNVLDKQTEISMAIDAEVNGEYEENELESEGGDVNSEMLNVLDKQTEISGHQHEETEVASAETEFDAHQREETEVANAETESDAHQLDVVESSAYQQEETEATSAYQQEEIEANSETVPEEGTGEVAENSVDMSAETTDEVDGVDLEEESGLGEVVDDAGSEEILWSSRNQKQVIVLFSTVMALLVAVATGFLLAKKKAKPVILQPEDGEPATVSDTKEVEHVPVEKLIKQTLSTLNFQEEQEVNDDRKREVSSFPSETSFSFHNRSLHSCNNRDELKEYQSGGGGKKSNDSGESMASSASEYSIGSVSYGSFTTYEKIQKRSGRKEEDVMVTPVRRSSRIRNHQTTSGQ